MSKLSDRLEKIIVYNRKQPKELALAIAKYILDCKPKYYNEGTKEWHDNLESGE